MRQYQATGTGKTKQCKVECLLPGPIIKIFKFVKRRAASIIEQNIYMPKTISGFLNKIFYLIAISYISSYGDNLISGKFMYLTGSFIKFHFITGTNHYFCPLRY